jgi:hypothetical protein
MAGEPIKDGSDKSSSPRLTEEVDVPSNINKGLVCPAESFLIKLLGKPCKSPTKKNQPITNQDISILLRTRNIGPFVVTGIDPAVADLAQIMKDIAFEQREVYEKLGTDGMLSCRLKASSMTQFSSHSWGTAIDLKIGGVRDTYKDNKVLYGLTLIAPIFNRHGWYWGAGFSKEDGMHFEASVSKLKLWNTAGLLGARKQESVNG